MEYSNSLTEIISRDLKGKNWFKIDKIETENVTLPVFLIAIEREEPRLNHENQIMYIIPLKEDEKTSIEKLSQIKDEIKTRISYSHSSSASIISIAVVARDQSVLYYEIE